MRALALLPFLLALSAQAAAQVTDGGTGSDPMDGRLNQKIERIRHEDAGSRIDEVRVGGQTERISVQPKMEGMPAYEVQPGSSQRGRSTDPREGLGSAGGQRSWSVWRF